METVILSSKQNERIKSIKRLYKRKVRDQEQLMLAEGIRLVEELVKTHLLTQVFYAKRLTQNSRGMQLLTLLEGKNIPLFFCSDPVFNEVSDTDTAQGIVAVAKRPQPTADWNRSQCDLILIVDQVQDPGNLGTIIRTAAGAGVTGLWITKGTVDSFSPKVVRASMGAMFQIPYMIATGSDCIRICRTLGYKLVVTDVQRGRIHYQCDLRGSIVLVVGNEGHGVSNLFLQEADERLLIPLTNSVESLNVSVATGILLYESMRQRYLQEL